MKIEKSELFQEIAEKEEKYRAKRISGSIIDSSIFESVLIDKKPVFLIYNGVDWKVSESIIDGTIKYVPLDIDGTPYIQYDVNPDTLNTKEDKNKLLNDIYQELKIFVDIPDIWRKIISSTILMSYQQHKLFTEPYFFIVGDTNSGKTTLLLLLFYLAYRPLYGASIPSADIYTYLEDNIDGVILEDEVQGVERDTEKSKIYKAGYKRGAKIPRIMNLPSGRRIIVYYPCFGLKVVAGERLPNNAKGFLERFIILQMIEGSPERDEFTPEDIQRFNNLRNRLLKWRMQNAFEPLPELHEEFLRGRIKELFKPILQMAYGSSFYDDILMFLIQLREEKIQEKRESFEGRLAYTILSLVKDKLDNPEALSEIAIIDDKELHIPFTTIWFRLITELNGNIDDRNPNKMTTEAFGDISKNRVGKRLKEILGSKVKLKRDGRSVYKTQIFTFNQLYRAGKKYALEESLLESIRRFVTDVTAVTDVTNAYSDDLNEDVTDMKVHSINGYKSYKGYKGLQNSIENIPPDILKYFDPGFDEYTVKCKLCNSYFSRNRADLEAHLIYHRQRGDIHV